LNNMENILTNESLLENEDDFHNYVNNFSVVASAIHAFVNNDLQEDFGLQDVPLYFSSIAIGYNYIMSSALDYHDYEENGEDTHDITFTSEEYVVHYIKQYEFFYPNIKTTVGFNPSTTLVEDITQFDFRPESFFKLILSDFTLVMD
jgi:hypothetical protein